MSMRRAHCAFLAVLAVASVHPERFPAQVPEVSPSIQALLDSGDRQRAAGEAGAAAASYREAKQRAQTDRDRAGVFLAELYLARAQLDAGELTESLATLDGLEASLVRQPDFDPALFYYLRGRVREATPDPQVRRSALEDYARAGSLVQAAAPALELLDALRPADKGARAEVIFKRLIDAGRHREALDRLLELLARAHWAEDAAAPALLRQVVECLRRIPITPPSYDESSYHARVGDLAAHRELRAAVAEISRAYSVEYPPGFRREWARQEVFPWWSGEEQRRLEFSRLLSSLGGYFDRRKRDGTSAMACFSLAFLLDEYNLDAAIRGLSVLRYAPDISPELRERMQAELVDDVFEQKGSTYRRAWGGADGRDVWFRLRGFHVLLGEVFAHEERWGSERDVKSAVFQWTLAIDAERKLLEKDPRARRIPDLTQRLGRALAGAGRDGDATDRFIAALQDARQRAPVEIGRVYAAFRSLGMVSERSESFQRQLQDQFRRSLGADSPHVSTFGPLAARDDGGVCVVDELGGAVSVIGVPSGPRNRSPRESVLNRPEFGRELAELLSAVPRQLAIVAMTVNPADGSLYFSVRIARDAPGSHLVRLDDQGRLSRMDPRDVRSADARWARLPGMRARAEGVVFYHEQAFVAETVVEGEAPPENLVRVVSFDSGRSHASAGTPVRAYHPRRGDEGLKVLRSLGSYTVQDLGRETPELGLIAVFDGGIATFSPADLQPGSPLSLRVTGEFEDTTGAGDVVAFQMDDRLSVIVATHSPGLLVSNAPLDRRAGTRLQFSRFDVRERGRFERLARLDERSVLALERRGGAPGGDLGLRVISLR